MNKRLLLGMLMIAPLAASSVKPDLKALYNQHRWFELREAIKGQEATPLYKGAVASAFNDSKAAEKYLKQEIELQPNSDNAVEAHEGLVNLYGRSGRFHEVVQQLHEILRIKPGSPDVENTLPMFTA